MSTALQGLLVMICNLIARLSAIQQTRNARLRMLFVNFFRVIAAIHVVMSIAFSRSSFFGPMNSTI